MINDFNLAASRAVEPYFHVVGVAGDPGGDFSGVDFHVDRVDRGQDGPESGEALDFRALPAASLFRVADRGEQGEFRSNLHRGGRATAIKLTAQERSTAVRERMAAWPPTRA